MEKTLGTTVGLVIAGVVAYKILQRKSPALVRKVKRAVGGAKDEVTGILKSAKASFREGYESA